MQRKFTKTGFTLIEILVGLSVSSAIFILATSLVVNIFSSSTKGKQTETLEQTKNDLQAEFGNSIRWADSLSFSGGRLIVDNTAYYVEEGRLYKENEPLTSGDVVVTRFEVKQYATQAGTSPQNSGTGLTGQYFNNQNFSSPVFTQVDYLISNNWGLGSPDTLIDPDTFSIRYSGLVEAPTSGEYTFYLSAEDGARLWVDNTLVIDNWSPSGFTELTGRISLTGGEKYLIRLDYFETIGNAALSLFWSYPSVLKQTIPPTRLYPNKSPSNIEVIVEMHHENNPTLLDALKLTLSPRGGNVSIIQ